MNSGGSAVEGGVGLKAEAHLLYKRPNFLLERNLKMDSFFYSGSTALKVTRQTSNSCQKNIQTNSTRRVIRVKLVCVKTTSNLGKSVLIPCNLVQKWFTLPWRVHYL